MTQPPDPDWSGTPSHNHRPPPQPQVFYQPHQTNGLAVASLVLGILWIYWIGSILALIFGYRAKSQIDASGGAQSGRGLAIAGIVLGWVAVGFLGLFVPIVMFRLL